MAILGAKTKEEFLAQAGNLWDTYQKDMQQAKDLLGLEDRKKPKAFKVNFTVDILDVNDVDMKVTTHIKFVKEQISDSIEESVETIETSPEGKGKGKK